MGNLNQSGAWWKLIWVAAVLTGCPPTGDVEPFVDVQPDAQVDAEVETPPECIDEDNDGFVEGDACANGLPGGDCFPRDGERYPGAQETCDNRDEDCDDDIDEQAAMVGDDCESGGAGACSAGLLDCRSGGRLVCTPIETQRPETCDGVDNDCDGSTDETFPTAGTPCTTDQLGICSDGMLACVDEGNGAEITCVPLREPMPMEGCNNADDDCDGNTDEGNPEGGEACNSGLPGVCSVGARECINGMLSCQPTVEAGSQEEICDGLDNDCDNETDEGFDGLGDPCAVGEGACRVEGTLICNPDPGEGDPTVICDVVAGDMTPEVCDGVDNDCDGTTDEDFPLGDACEVGQGECLRAGSLICTEDGMGTVCDVMPGEAIAEICNGLDDDCDGTADEAFVDLGQPCVDASGQCPSPGTLICNEAGDGLECDAEPVMPVDETCNGEDDDCDGSTDEAFPTLGDPCEVGLGVCLRAGQLVCNPVGDAVTCSVEPGEASPELCDGLDNDCDGRLDNRALCPNPPTGVIRGLSIAAVDDARCRDFDRNGMPDNALSAVGALFNDALALSVANNQRLQMLRAPGFGAEAPFPLEALAGRAAGMDIAVDPAALDAVGNALSVIPQVNLVGGALSTATRGADFEFVSPFFHDRDAAFTRWSFITLDEASAVGLAALDPMGGLRLSDVALTGLLDRDAIVTAYTEAEAACNALPAQARPAGCAVFVDVSAAAFAQSLVADTDRDNDMVNESITACFILRTVPAQDAQMPPLGGQDCSLDDDCLAGLVCRPVPVIEDPRLGAALQVACGVPGPGGLADGQPCAQDDDCLRGLCAAVDAGAPRCITLCENGPDDCAEGQACRGIALDVPGALNLGGRSAPVCVSSAGSGLPCQGGTCEGEEICNIYFQGDLAEAGGVVAPQALCLQADDRGVAQGQPCGDALGCTGANRCVPDLEDVRRCLAPCGSTAECGPGAACLERSMVEGLDEQGAEFGFCVPVPPEFGSGRPCTSEQDCLGGEACQAQFLEATGTVDRYCARGVGFFGVGQACEVSEDCASGVCSGGLCSGLCEDNDDCGSRLGCIPGATVDPDSGRPLAGACQPVDARCLRDADCSAEPACEGGRCVCAGGACRIGCRFPGVCPDGLFCQPDNTCLDFCRDDPEEPNDSRPTATTLPLGRDEPVVVQGRRMCVTSSVDWYRFNAAGQPFSLRVTPVGGELDAQLEVTLFDPQGAPVDIQAVPGDLPGEQILVFDDAVQAADWVAEQLFVRIRAGGILTSVDYELFAEILYPDCPDDEQGTRDNPWQFDPLIHVSGQNVNQEVTSWLCPGDDDWFAFRAYNGYVVGTEDPDGEGPLPARSIIEQRPDRITIDFTNLGNEGALDGSELEVDLVGPDWPEVGGQVIQTITAEVRNGQIVLDAPIKNCFVQPPDVIGECRFENGVATTEQCDASTPCLGSTYFLRIRGRDPMDFGQYRVRISAQRGGNLECPEDMQSPMSFLGDAASARSMLAVDPAARASSGGVPTLAYGQDAVVETLTLCPGDVDGFSLAMAAGESLLTEVTQVQNSPPVGFNYNLIAINGETGGLEVGDFGFSQNRVFQFLRPANLPNATRYSVVFIAPPAEGAATYNLRMRRFPVTAPLDQACEVPINLPLSPVDNRASVRSTTAGATDDHRPLGCLGGFGPDRVYAIQVPGPGTLTAIVEAARPGDGYDPSVSIRTACDAQASELACNEDDVTIENPLSRARASGEVFGGVAYVIVDSYSDLTTGEFQLSVVFEPAP